jgi:DNA-binding transcriptional regulator LsrR (DeoR family)
MTGEGKGQTVAEMIILHLFHYMRFMKDFLCPRELTQDGIAERLGKYRGHVASELRKLRADGQVEFEVTHAPMARTKRKAFFLTQKGITRAMRLKERAETERARAAQG